MSSRQHEESLGLPFWARHPVMIPIAAAFVVVAMLAGIASIAAHRSDEGLKDAAQGRVRTNGDAAVRALIRETDDYKRAVATLATDRPIISTLTSGDADSLRATQDELSNLARSNASPAAFISDLSGRDVAVYPPQPDLLGKKFAYRDWFKGVSRTGKPYVSVGYRTAAAGHPLVVAVAAPVSSAGKRVGYVTILWQLDSVRAVSDGARRDDGVTIAVTDQAGQPLLRRLRVNSLGEAQMIKPSATVRKALAGHHVSTVKNGVLVEAAPVPGIGWTVSASMPVSIALQPSAQFRHRQEITLGVALILVALFTGFSTRLVRGRAGAQKDLLHERSRLLASEERFRRVFDHGFIGKILANTDGEIIQMNSTMARLLGCEIDDLVGQPFSSIIHDEADKRAIAELIRDGDAELQEELAIHDADMNVLWSAMSITWLSEPRGTRVLLAEIEDVTARRDAETRLSYLSLHDELTGLPNRRLLLERCERAFAIARSGRVENTTLTVLFIDLDGFKKVNDWAGHDVGDDLLRAIAGDLRASVRPADTVARIGGDEFIVLIEQDNNLTYVRSVAQRITDAVRREVSAKGSTLAVSASVGIARLDLADEPDVLPDQLLRRADAAMYRAKQRGRDRHDLYDAKLRDSTEARQALEVAMLEGLREDRISLVFQPIVDVDSNSVIGAEALMRLRDASGRLLPTLPAVIAAEEAGMAEQLGDRVMDLALAAATTWPAHLSIAVNISARELTGRSLSERVKPVLERYAFDPHRLILEITESSVLNAGPSALADIGVLRRQGIRVAIDDFGTSFATLTNLTTLPVDIVKLDATFTAGLPDLPAHSAVVHGVAAIAAELDIPCVIEGVETEAQLIALRGMGVHAQGWWWGKPRGPEHVPALIIPV